MLRLLIVFMAVLLISLHSASARTLYVSKTGDGSTGVSWETGFPTVTEAIESATAGDHIWVASGSYNEAISLKPEIELYGGFSGNENEDQFDLRSWRTNATILDATGLHSTVVNGAENCQIDGFTITNGEGRFTVNTGSGGIACFNIQKMVIANCRIVNNRAFYEMVGNSVLGGVGGGINGNNANVDIYSCEILSNRADIFGGGIALLQGNHVVENCLFDQNFGSGLVVESADSISVTHCTFGLFNTSYVFPSKGPDISVTGTPFGSFKLTNSIIRNTSVPYGSVASYNNVKGASGNGNIDIDPEWRNPEDGDYRLRLSSPCIDSASTEGLSTDLDGNPRPVDVLGAGHDGPGAFDMGCYEFQLKKADFNRNGAVDGEDLLFFQEEWMSQRAVTQE